PELSELRIIGDIVACRRPLHARGRAIELDQPTELGRTLRKAFIPDIALTNKSETDMALLQRDRLRDGELGIEPRRLSAFDGRGLQQGPGARILVAELHALLPVRTMGRGRHAPLGRAVLVHDGKAR